MKTLLLLPILLALACSGCATATHFADNMTKLTTAVIQSTNSITIEINSIYGTFRLTKNTVPAGPVFATANDAPVTVLPGAASIQFGGDGSVIMRNKSNLVVPR